LLRSCVACDIAVVCIMQSLDVLVGRELVRGFVWARRGRGEAMLESVFEIDRRSLQ
jgi:hypothetical protein